MAKKQTVGIVLHPIDFKNTDFFGIVCPMAKSIHRTFPDAKYVAVVGDGSTRASKVRIGKSINDHMVYSVKEDYTLETYHSMLSEIESDNDSFFSFTLESVGHEAI